MPAPRPLYRLPELAQAAGAVTVVEGEKCVEACLRAWPGKPAVTTWAHGSGSWQQTDWSPLAGRDVSLLADTDGPGREAIRELAAHLNGMGCNVRLALPEGETGEDVADWIEADGADAVLERVAELLGPFKPPAETGPEPAAEAEREGGELSEHAVRLRSPHATAGRSDSTTIGAAGTNGRATAGAHDRKHRAFDYVRRIAAEFNVKRGEGVKACFRSSGPTFAERRRDGSRKPTPSHAVDIGLLRYRRALADGRPWRHARPEDAGSDRGRAGTQD